MIQKNKNYVIGVDGGGTKTIAALADLNGKILKLAKTGSSHPRNVGLKKAMDNLAQAIEKVLPTRLQAGHPKKITSITFKKLNFQDPKFPVVLIGSVFKSKIVLDTVKREVRKIAPKVNFIWPKQEPVIGAVKLAIEQLK